MSTVRKTLSGIFIAFAMLPGCTPQEGDSPSSGGASPGSGGAPRGSGGAPVITGGVAGSPNGGSTPANTGGGSSGGNASTAAGGVAGNQGGSAADNSGGNVSAAGNSGRGGSINGSGGSINGSGGSSAGATGGRASGGAGSGASGGSGAGVGGAAGGSGSGGTGGTLSGTGGARTTVQVATAVPTQYRNPVSNPGKWAARTYPVYYYTTQKGGSPSLTTTPKQSQPITKPCNVYTPPGYDPQIQYPVIFVLHGITDNENTWMERGDPKPNILLDNLITSKVIQPVVAVFPQGNSKPDFATDKSYTDTAGYYLFGNELMNDLLPFIEANYSVKKDRNSRALAGFSMGGMQTINIGLCQNLKSIAWFGALSPAGGPFSSTQIAQYLQTQDAATYPVSYFYVTVGQSDTTAGASADASTNQLTSKGPYITQANFTYHKVPGGHVYPTVTVGLYNFLRIAFSN